MGTMFHAHLGSDSNRPRGAGGFVLQLPPDQAEVREPWYLSCRTVSGRDCDGETPNTNAGPLRPAWVLGYQIDLADTTSYTPTTSVGE